MVRQALDGLNTDNREAWGLFQTLCTRFLIETKSVGPVFVRLCEGRDVEDVTDLALRVALIYDVYYPPRSTPDGA